MDWAQILVIILSLFLGLFILLGIILAIMLIKLTRQIRNVADTAQRTASGVEGVVVNITKFTSPGFVLKMVTGQIKKLKKRK